MDYYDFELEIRAGHGRDYPVSVVRSPAGEAAGTMHFPFDQLALTNHLQALQIALLRSGGVGRARRGVVPPDEKPVREFGKALFDSLLSGDLRSCYDVSRRDAALHGAGLRVKLRIEAPELAALPWEYLFDTRQAEYLCFSRRTPLVRYLDVPLPTQPLTVQTPVKILGMIANPKDLATLDTKRERQRLEEALAKLRVRGLVEVHWVEGETWRDLQREMRGGPWHIFHFIGHGGFDTQADEGLIALSDDDGQTYRLRAQLLGRLLNDHQTLRLVVLNACEGAQASASDVFSSTAATLLRRGIPAVLAMQFEISDAAAIEFGRSFYSAVADGLPVDAAVSEARSAVSYAIDGTLEWGTPVLYMRSPDGRIFDLQRSSTAVEEVVPQPAPELRPAGSGRRIGPIRLGQAVWTQLAVLAAAAVVGLGALVLVRGWPVSAPPVVPTSVALTPTALVERVATAPPAAPTPTLVSSPKPGRPPGWVPVQLPSLASLANSKAAQSSWRGGLSVDSGSLVWTTTSSDTLNQVALPLETVIDSDQYVSLDTTQTKGPGAWFGLALRYKDDRNFFELQVNTAVHRVIFKAFIDNHLDRGGERDYNPAPAGKPDTVAARIEGTHFTFYVNDKEVGAGDDGRLTGGRPGLTVEIPADTAERAFSFSNLQVFVPPSSQ